MKKLLWAGLFLFLLLSEVFCVSAIKDYDINYEGILGSYYETEGDTEEEAGTDDSRVSITSDISYNINEKLFYIYASDIKQPFTSNVTDGMITKDTVSISVPVGVSCTLYRDGEEYTGDLAAVSEKGSYSLNIKTNAGAKEKVLTFVIVGDSSANVNQYNMPSGFSVKSLVVDGKQVTANPSTVSFENEGVYEITYICPVIGTEYTLNLTIDHTPPTLSLEGVKDQKIWGPVDISDVEPGATVYVYREGEIEEVTDNKLTKSGKYDLVVEDEAGNRTDYSFTIMIYFNAASIVFFVLFLIFTGLLGAYILFSRKKLRVR